ncbi:MAG TPA: methyltransferase domain-containing protein [bacterium]|nr:methyltransferase domain-containing protein [bacterium]HPN43222.1 methyltransferase domain-containing protein [bacterium]
MAHKNKTENTGQASYEQIMLQVQQAVQSNRTDDAVALLNKALLLKPDDAVIHNNLGVIYYAQNKLELAKTHLQHALQNDPQYFDAAMNLAKVFRKSGDHDNARLYAQKCCTLQPQNSRAVELLHSIEQSNEKLPPAVSQSGERDKFNILFVQEAPCIRNYKMAAALRTRGHSVTLAWTRARLSQMYPGLDDNVYTACIQLTTHKQLWDISGQYDLVHCHNEPDILTVAALAGKAPVIHDTHDLISLRASGDANLTYFEGVANRGVAGRVYTTPYQLQEAQQLYGSDGPSIVLYNYTSQADLPDVKLPKLSTRDGQVHIVYEGGIGGNTHRNFIELFRQLAQGNIHIHIYPTFYSQELADFFAQTANIHYYQPCSPKQIMEQMTQYDIGIIPFNLEKGNKRFLDSTIANKLFEYLAAGLPVFTSPLLSYIDFFNKYPVGKTFTTGSEIILAIPDLLEIAKKTDFSKYVFTYEHEISRLEDLYRTVIAARVKPPLATKLPLMADCPICGHTGCDLTIEQNGFKVHNCPACNTLFVHPRPDDQFLRNWYSEEEKKKRWNNDLQQAIIANHKQNEFNYCHYFKVLQETVTLTGKGKVLDIGCFDGLFLQQFKTMGYECTGIDLNEGLLRYGRENYGLDLKCGAVYDFRFPDNSFDIIIFHQVLEHQADPVAFITEVKRILTDDGIIFFSVPNAGALRYQLLGRYCPADSVQSILDLPNHLFYFSHSSLETLLTAGKFTNFIIKSYGQPDSINEFLKSQAATEQDVQDAKNQLLTYKNPSEEIYRYTGKVIKNTLANIAGEYEEKTDTQPGLLVIAGKLVGVNDKMESASDYVQNIPLLDSPPLALDDPNLIIHLSKAIIQLYKWLKLHGTVGYDPGDIDSKMLQLDTTAGQKVNRESYKTRQFSEPMQCRTELEIQQHIYPDSFGHFLTAFCLLPFELDDLNLTNRKQYCYETLLQGVNKDFTGLGWGFPYLRDNYNLLPAGVPDAITTYFVGDGLWNYFKNINDQEILNDCCRIAEFYASSLNRESDQDKIALSFSPIDYLFTHSANLFAAEFLLRLGMEVNNQEWIDLANTILQTSTDEISPEGFITKYTNSVKKQGITASCQHLDHVYHLLALTRISRLLKKPELDRQITLMMDHYSKTCFTNNLLPQEPGAQKTGVDTLTLGMIIILLAENAVLYKPAENILLRLLTWAFDHLITNSGSFVSHFSIHNGNVQVNRFAHFIRQQACIFNGLLHTLDYLNAHKPVNPVKTRLAQEVLS